MRLFEAVGFLRDALRESGNQESEVQARQMAAGLLHLDPVSYLVSKSRVLTDEEQDRLKRALARRLSGEPLQYILGEWPFFGRTFACDSRALIPREDTETLAAAVLDSLPEDRHLRGIDLGSGTGILGLTLAAERPSWEMTCLDISREALSLARENAERLGLERVHFLHASMLDPLPGGPYDLIVSNPPYVRRDEIQALERELRYEPHIALDGGPDGLDFYRALALRFSDSLSSGGILAMEVGYDQAGDVSALLTPAAESICLFRDPSGIDRVVMARK